MSQAGNLQVTRSRRQISRPDNITTSKHWPDWTTNYNFANKKWCTQRRTVHRSSANLYIKGECLRQDMFNISSTLRSFSLGSKSGLVIPASMLFIICSCSIGVSGRLSESTFSFASTLKYNHTLRLICTGNILCIQSRNELHPGINILFKGWKKDVPVSPYLAKQWQ